MKRFTVSSLITWIYSMYLELVYATSNIYIVEDKIDDYNDCIIGFWHGDSFCNYMLFKEIGNKESNIDAIITNDKRGDIISNICKKYDINPIRVKDGIKIRENLNDIKELSKKKDRSIAIALDGPLGPIYEPKKMAFMLSNYSKKRLVTIDLEIENKIILTNRWDEYKIPLPFSKMVFILNKRDYIRDDEIKDFKLLKAEFRPQNRIKYIGLVG